MDLKNAWLCMDCDTVYDGGSRGWCPGRCPACGSAAGWPVMRWLQPMAGSRPAVVFEANAAYVQTHYSG